MKKLFVLLAAGILACCFAGCTKHVPDSPEEDKQMEQAQTSVENSNDDIRSFALDGTISHYGMSIKYPKDWDATIPKELGETGIIYAPCGGNITFNTSLMNDYLITTDTSESYIRSFIEVCTSVPDKTMSILKVQDYDIERENDAVIARVPVDMTMSGTPCYAYQCFGIIGHNLGICYAIIPSDADEKYKATVDEIVKSFSMSYVELKPTSSTDSAEKDDAVQDQKGEVSPTATASQTNALKVTRQYLTTMPFSYTGLISQLEYEGFSTEDATYAADNCGADWNTQAARTAKNYLNIMAFTRDGLIEQLQYEGYTYDEASFGADSVGL